MNYEIEIENYTMIKKLQMIFPDIKYYIVYRLSHNRKGQSSTPGGMEKTRILFENTSMKRQKRKRRKVFPIFPTTWKFDTRKLSTRETYGYK